MFVTGARLIDCTGAAPILDAVVEIRGKRILDWTVEALEAGGVTEICFVGGYRMEAVEISGGLRYVSIGDATSGGAGGFQGTFSGNSAVGVGVRISVSF
jgi:NDP-sugar pyrophosphorylase family protein